MLPAVGRHNGAAPPVRAFPRLGRRRSRTFPWLLAATLFVLAGCQDAPACADEDAAAALLAQGRGLLADPFSEPAALRFEGTLNGTPLRADAARMSATPEQPARVLLSGSIRGTPVEVHAAGAYLSVEAGDVAYVARDHAPGQDNAVFLETYFGDGIPFAEGLDADDFAVSCIASSADGGTGPDKVLFAREEGDVKHAIEVERGTGAFLAAQQVDGQASSYVVHWIDEPTVVVDLSLPRMPARIDLVQVDYQEDETAYAFRWTIGDGSHWVPIDEAAFALVDENGTVVETMPLGNGTHMRHGRHTYEDRDGNGLVSPGDVLSAGAARGFRVTLWDAWADAQFQATR